MTAPFSAVGEPREDHEAALRLGAAFARIAPVDPVAWIALAERAGMQPTFCPAHGLNREGMFNKVADTDHDLRDFLVGWLNSRPREELAGVIDLLRRRSNGGSRGERLAVPPEIIRVCLNGFGLVDINADGSFRVDIPARLVVRLTGINPEICRSERSWARDKHRARLARRAWA